MTVNYSTKSFLRLLLRWKGSVWKAVLPNMVVFLVVYYSINLCYRYAMDSVQQRVFERVVVGTAKALEDVPLEYLIGFYVGIVISRWWSYVKTMPDTTRFANTVSAFIATEDGEDIKIARALSRHAFSSIILALRSISLKVRKRFPTEKYLVHNGIWSETDLTSYTDTCNSYDRWYVPLQWCANLASKCYSNGRLSDNGLHLVLEELNILRRDIRYLIGYDKITVPLIYTQLVTVSTLFYFIMCIVAQQSLITDTSDLIPGYEVDIGFPIFTLLELLCYLGWMKVGPFGEDDDDIHIHHILDRMFGQAMYLCSEKGNEMSSVCGDRFESYVFGIMANTVASQKYKVKIGSADDRRLDVDVIPEKDKPIAIECYDRIDQGPWIGKGTYTKHDRHLLAPGLKRRF